MIVLDVETTGVSPSKHSIVGIGAVEFENPSNQFYLECRIWDGAEVRPEALEINGMTMAQITDPAKPSQEEAIKQFLAWCEPIGDKTLGGHNTNFDEVFMGFSCRRVGLRSPFGVRVVDLHSLCYAHHLGRLIKAHGAYDRSILSSDHVHEYVGLPAEPRPHNALTGAKHETEALGRFIFGRSIMKEFAKYPVPEYLSQEAL